MPIVNFMGEIFSVVADYDSISVSWAIVPGNASWIAKFGETYGESQTCMVSPELGQAILNHPLDVQFETSSMEGWPFLVFEVWDKSEVGSRNLVGCGSAFLPQAIGAHHFDIYIWKPTNPSWYGKLLDMFLPPQHDPLQLREAVATPYVRSQMHAVAVGSVEVKINVVQAGFGQHGVDFG